MWLLGFTMLWAEERQELVYTISQNGREIGQRNVVITYFPPSKSVPTAYKKVEVSSDCTLNIAGKSVRYQQKGLGQFSAIRSNFVISNQIDDRTIEKQGKRDINGNWTVFNIQEGKVLKEKYTSMEVYLTSIEMFIPKIWMDGDRLDVLILEGEYSLVQNTVWKEGKVKISDKKIKDHIEQSNTASTNDVSISDVRDKDGVLLFSSIQALGTDISFSLTSMPKDINYGELKEENTFSGIEEQEL